MSVAVEHPRLSPLMEEARRRARRRRAAYALAVLALAGGALYLGLQLGGGGGGSAGGAVAQRGFRLVQARGPVEHAVMDIQQRYGPRTIDLANGQAAPSRVSKEIWWDRKTGFTRVIERVDGQLRSDVVGQTCGPVQGTGRRSCLVPSPFALRPGERGVHLYGVSGAGRKVGTGRFHGERVVWKKYAGVPGGCRCFAVLGVSVRTGEPVVYRSYAAGHTLTGAQVNTFKPDVSARSFSFAVPEGGVSNHCLPVCAGGSGRVERTGLPAVRHALGRAPVWFGSSFRGRPLERAEVGVSSLRAQNGKELMPARFVRLDYGIATVKEFATRPFWFRSGPPAGRAVLESVRQLSLSRDGLLVIVTVDRGYRLRPTTVPSIVAALRPL